MVDYQLGRVLTRAGGPLVRVKVPKLKSPRIVALPLPKTGPMGLIAFVDTAVGELTPVNIEPVRKLRGGL
ncbi:MAG: hypothetical protein QXP81_09315 [Nitrososphaerota archaeon]